MSHLRFDTQIQVFDVKERYGKRRCEGGVTERGTIGAKIRTSLGVRIGVGLGNWKIDNVGLCLDRLDEG
jgi:hypothetical protein